MQPDELVRRYAKVSSPTVYDVLDKMGFPNQAVSSDIRPLARGWRIAGPALTIHGRSMSVADGRWGTAFSYEMFRAIQPGDVLVMDTGGHDQGGPWGGNTAANAHVKGAAGIIVDGGTRDVSDLVAMNFPTFCRFVTPVLAHGRFQIEGFNHPITVSGQIEPQLPVAPGDFIVADDDGILVVPKEMIEEVLEYAEAAEQAETEIRRALEAGEDRESVDARIDRWAVLRTRRKR